MCKTPAIFTTGVGGDNSRLNFHVIVDCGLVDLTIYIM